MAKSKCSYIAGHTDTWYLVPANQQHHCRFSAKQRLLKAANLSTGKIRKKQALMMVNYNHDDVEMALAPT
jgi:hypothetical protein